ncbi:LytS/YhcK type 5TM receptor domain-containing protein [uncultured Desulfobacter sp.]|uniref:sensor histidine kinase n=1 Tax=uncultured Desulfobacter sp. TaxID=240139 RepID=UPI002AAACD6B|nr:LytS/YhcK type 5TM receptor domain-containing protein [uncultured Desulfobacter sp.]
MSASILIGLIHNAALLLLLGAIYNTTVRNPIVVRSTAYQTAFGILVGGICIVLMLTPVQWAPGIVFDTRTILLSVTGLFFGPITTLVAMTIAGLYRFNMGGGGAAMGIATIVSSSLIGLAWRHYRGNKLSGSTALELLRLGAAVHVVMIINTIVSSSLIGLAWRHYRGNKLSGSTALELLRLGAAVHVVMIINMTLLPYNLVFKAISTLSLPVIIIYPIATMFLGLFIINLEKKYLVEKALDISNRKYKNLMKSATDGIHILDQDGKLVETNQAFLKMLGYDEAAANTLSVSDWATQWPKDETLQKLRSLASSPSPVLFETLYRKSDGRIIDVEVNACGIQLGDTTYLYASARDISGRKEISKKFEENVRDLALIHAELQQLTYLIYHELQEPLRQTMGAAQLLAKRYIGRLDRDADEFIDLTIDGVRRMETQINDLLAYLKVGTGYATATTSDSDHALIRAVASLGERIQESGGRITHDERLPKVAIAEDLLVMVFYNLLDNSLKFRRDEPPVIHVGARRTEATITFSVTDNGLGIAQKHHEQIFLLFKRVHHRNEYPGSGIGLAICKRIVERQNGRIWLESVVGRGSTFYFSLSLAKDVEHAE